MEELPSGLGIGNASIASRGRLNGEIQLQDRDIRPGEEKKLMCLEQQGTLIHFVGVLHVEMRPDVAFDSGFRTGDCKLSGMWPGTDFEHLERCSMMTTMQGSQLYEQYSPHTLCCRKTQKAPSHYLSRKPM